MISANYQEKNSPTLTRFYKSHITLLFINRHATHFFMKTFERVSIHGGHSGQFCLHAEDSLESIIQQYIDLKFSWVGITEHIPPPTNALRYPDQADAGLSSSFLTGQFDLYIQECTRLKQKYSHRIKLYLGFETETWTGYKEQVNTLLKKYKPDYIVGSVHHVDDMGIDYSESHYHETAGTLGGIDNLYRRYFDLQHEMITALNPSVIGHFDLVRLFDDDYENRIRQQAIWSRIKRNLELIKKNELILDFNLRSLSKGGHEPYIAQRILKKARQLNIAVVPGDDSHGIKDIGTHTDTAIGLLQQAGFTTQWHRPKLYTL